MIETKVCNISLDGKDGEVFTSYVQRHIPECGMTLIILESGHTLFCQNNHPIFVLTKDNEIIEKSAEFVDINSDKIWMNNTISRNEEDIIPNISPELIANYYVKNYITIPDIDILKGERHNFRFNSDFIKYNKHWLKMFIEYLSEDTNILSIYSYNLVQQLKLICDRIGYTCIVTNTDYIKDDLIFNIFIYPSFNIEKSEIIKDYIKISKKITDLEWNHYVYDIKTSSDEFLSGCVQTHNSFHLGGIVIVKKPDIISNLLENVEDVYSQKILSCFYQDNMDLRLSTDFAILRINKNIFIDEKYKIEEKKDSNTILLKVGYFEIEIEGMTIPITIEQDTFVYYTQDTREDDENNIKIVYNKDDKIIRLEPVFTRPELVANKIDEYVAGKSPWSRPEELYTKFFKMLSEFGGWDSVHLETIISNIVRWKKDPHYPARVKDPYDPQMFNIKALPGKISYPLGITLENFGVGVATGLSNDRAPESSIEKVLFGSPLSEDD